MEALKENDIVGLISEEGRKWFVKLEKKHFSTHEGLVDLQDIIGKTPGDFVITNTNQKLYFFLPSLEELLLYYVKRSTQIIYPKDAGYLILKLGIKQGMKILEVGTGSGAMTLILSYFAGSGGKVYTYEAREEFSKKAKNLIEQMQFSDRVVFYTKNIEDGIEEHEFDCAVIDLKEPENYLGDIVECLSYGAVFGIVVPTTNQVSNVIRICETLPVINLEVCEILFRKYRINPERLRPFDVMVGHTAYLIAGRKIKT
ncbi:MAG TPA: tRNA (adenine-N1)-methyltransferase [bacterium]|nr:tRNA (adenine-N1)-methyltransferase [bacterium]